tara:strand:+ start:761 stop:1042 length:282 start_codon:yes stop_codon:yes gene_type:complete
MQAVGQITRCARNFPQLRALCNALKMRVALRMKTLNEAERKKIGHKINLMWLPLLIGGFFLLIDLEIIGALFVYPSMGYMIYLVSKFNFSRWV